VAQRDGEGIVVITARPEMDDRKHQGVMWSTKLHTYVAKRKRERKSRTGEKQENTEGAKRKKIVIL